MNPKARITYRFDGKQAAARKQETERKVVTLYPGELQFAADVAPWNSPFQDDPSALERLIRETDGQPVERMPSAETARPHRSELRHDRMPQRPGKQPILIETTEAAEEYDEYVSQAPDFVLLGDEGNSETVTMPIPVREAVTPAAQPTVLYVPELEHDEDRARTAASENSEYTGYVVHRRRSGGPSWLKVFASVAGALLTGALFGYVILTLFTGEPAAPTAEQPEKPVISGDATQPVVADQSDAGGAAAPVTPGENAMIAVELPARSYAMLQYGVFSNPEGMKAAVADLKDKGYAAAADTLDGYRVFAGIAPDKTEAAALADQLDVAETFVKTIQVPAANQVRFNGDAQSVLKFMNATDAFIRAGGDVTAEQLMAAGAGSFDDTQSEAWRTAYEAWQAALTTFDKGVANEDRESAERLAASLQSAASLLDRYEESGSRAQLWEAQSRLMDAVFAQKEWMMRF